MFAIAYCDGPEEKLSPSGAKDEDGNYHNVHLNLHEDELAVAGMDIGDEVFVRVRRIQSLSRRLTRTISNTTSNERRASVLRII